MVELMELEKQRYAKNKVYTRRAFKGLKRTVANPSAAADGEATAATDGDKNNSCKTDEKLLQPEAPEKEKLVEKLSSLQDLASEDSVSVIGPREVGNRVKINLVSRSRSKSNDDTQNLRRKLQSELETVRTLAKRIKEKEEVIVGGFGRSHGSGDNGEAARPLKQLNVSLLENVEKEKRTPKANPYYRNSEFLLANDKLPPAESNKKSKSNGKKHGALESGKGMGAKFSKSCSSLLERLMKHKHGWVFNIPVDVKALMLHDYHIIIEHPMDLGTVKSRLNENRYKSPRDFAEDVRLTFRNAMTYNPPGQDVHVMAELLSKVFEERWAIIESDYNRETRFQHEYAPLSVPRPPPLDMRRILDRSESTSHSVEPKAPSSRTHAPKKPKARDPNKRDMNFEEKQKLSTNLQSLPSEKLDIVIQIIKKRNSAALQHDDEIEVDIDGVDAETLWELDRFLSNYKKGLSKIKRKTELAIQAQNPAPVVAAALKYIRADERNVTGSSPIQGAKEGGIVRQSSSSSSSSSDSESSSSDSDSDSSSASGSDVGRSPRS